MRSGVAASKEALSIADYGYGRPPLVRLLPHLHDTIATTVALILIGAMLVAATVQIALDGPPKELVAFMLMGFFLTGGMCAFLEKRSLSQNNGGNDGPALRRLVQHQYSRPHHLMSGGPHG